ncbi:MAG: threonine dehydrogenase [Candidatus Schekmanbacteria bacterium]|nr:MAG: threonine dehydrogenase [Candidatus Schekmanbacteria bacterium]
MKAAIFKGVNIISLEEITPPSLPEKGIIIKVKAAGICGTDVRIYRGKKMVTPPKIIGHEFAGEIVEVANDLQGFSIGDRVLVEAIIPCGNCYACRRGEMNICTGRQTLGYEYNGGFAEFVAIPKEAISAGCVIKIPDSVSYEEAAVCEPAAACINGNSKIDDKLRESLLVAGDGPVGLIHTQLGKIRGFEKVILAGTDDEKLKIGKELGADETVNVNDESLSSFIKEKIDEEGIECVVIANNNKSSLDECLPLLKKGGEAIIFAGYKNDESIEINLNFIHYKEIKIKGSSGHSVKEMKKAVELLEKGKLNLQKIITHRLNIDDVVKGIQMKENLVGIKHIITF